MNIKSIIFLLPSLVVNSQTKQILLGGSNYYISNALSIIYIFYTFLLYISVVSTFFFEKSFRLSASKVQYWRYKGGGWPMYENKVWSVFLFLFALLGSNIPIDISIGASRHLDQNLLNTTLSIVGRTAFFIAAHFCYDRIVYFMLE